MPTENNHPMTPAQVRELRQDAGLNQRQLADLMRLGEGGQGTISRWETGRSIITQSHALLLRVVCRHVVQRRRLMDEAKRTPELNGLSTDVDSMLEEE